MSLYKSDEIPHAGDVGPLSGGAFSVPTNLPESPCISMHLH